VLACAIGIGGEHGAFIERRRPIEDRFEHGVELVDARFGEETEAAKIHAEDWNVATRLRGPRRHAQERAVAAEDDDQIDFSGQRLARVGRRRCGVAGERGGIGLEHRLQLPVAQPFRKAMQMIGGGNQAGFGHDADARNVSLVHDARK
jgi:hypothetical protein